MSNEYPFSDLPTIDDAVASPLRELLGDSFFELVSDFTNDFPEKFNAIKTATNENDIESIFNIAHTLKSSSGSFGFTKLFKRLEYLELQARKNEIVNLNEQIDGLEQEFNEVVLMLNTK